MFLTSQEEPEVLIANFQVESNKLISTKAKTETLQKDISMVPVRQQAIYFRNLAHRMWLFCVLGFNILHQE